MCAHHSAACIRGTNSSALLHVERHLSQLRSGRFPYVSVHELESVLLCSRRRADACKYQRYPRRSRGYKHALHAFSNSDFRTQLPSSRRGTKASPAQTSLFTPVYWRPLAVRRSSEFSSRSYVPLMRSACRRANHGHHHDAARSCKQLGYGACGNPRLALSTSQ